MSDALIRRDEFVDSLARDRRRTLAVTLVVGALLIAVSYTHLTLPTTPYV